MKGVASSRRARSRTRAGGLRPEGHPPAAAAEGLDRGTRPVERQGEDRRGAGQGLPPPGEVRLQGAAFEALPLPDREVGVLHGERGQRLLPVQGRQLAQEDPHDQPSKAMWWTVTSSTCSRLVQPQQGGPERRPGLQIERPQGLGRGQAERLGLGLRERRQVHLGQMQIEPRRDHLHGRSAGRREGGPQDLVPGGDPRDRLAQRLRVEDAARAGPPPACCRPGSPGSSRSMNQSRSWPKERGRPAAKASRGTGTRGGSGRPRGVRAASTRAARPAMVRASNRARNGRSTPRSSRSRATIRAASSDWPPRSKKSSWTPGPLDSQDVLPDPGQQLLERRARRHVRGLLAEVGDAAAGRRPAGDRRQLGQPQARDRRRRRRGDAAIWSSRRAAVARSQRSAAYSSSSSIPSPAPARTG